MLVTNNYVSVIDNDYNRGFTCRTVQDLTLQASETLYFKIESYAFRVRSIFANVRDGDIKIETFTDGTDSGSWTEITSSISEHFMLNDSQHETTGQSRPQPNPTLLRVFKAGVYNKDGRKRDVCYIKSVGGGLASSLSSLSQEVLRGQQSFSHDNTQPISSSTKKRSYYICVQNLSTKVANMVLTIDSVQFSLTDNGE